MRQVGWASWVLTDLDWGLNDTSFDNIPCTGHMDWGHWRREIHGLNNRLHHPNALPYIFGAQILSAGGVALEYTRRSLGLDAAGYYLTGGGEETPEKAKGEAPTQSGARSGQKRLRSGEAKQESLDPVRQRLRFEPTAARPQKMDTSDEPTIEAARARGADSGMTGNSEDPVMPFGRVAEFAPDYFTVKGRFAGGAIFTGAVVDPVQGNSGNNAVPAEFQVRVNSPADWNLSVTVANQNNNEMIGFSHWKTMYSHYRLLKTDLRITFIRRRVQFDNVVVGTTNPATILQNKFLSNNNEIPILVGYVADPSNRLGNQLITPTTRNWIEGSQAKHSHFEWLQHGRLSMAYHYTPGAWDQSIETTQQDGIWTAVNANPSTQDVLHIVAYPLEKEAVYTLDVIVEGTMLVQFKQFTNNVITEMITLVPSGVQ